MSGSWRIGGLWAALIAVLGAPTAEAAAVDRRLEIRVSLEGQQDWRNALQWSKATTAQTYALSTTLRSDGVLHGANLLDTDQERRLAIKTEYLRRQGASKLKAAGLDPGSPGLQMELSQRMQRDARDCKGSATCMNQTSARYAELMAAALQPANPAVFEGEPRYQFFFGHPDCANSIHTTYRYEAAGETAYGRDKDKIFPYALNMRGEGRGTPEEQSALCRTFTVVLDTREQRLFIENIYLPAVRGQVVRTEFGKTATREDSLPAAEPLQAWMNRVLRDSAALSGTTSANLQLTLPLDGNSTVLGTFTGEARVQMHWAFTALPASTPP